MNVASKELCQELYELSGWDDLPHRHSNRGVLSLVCPGYDLGYLLRKLPKSVMGKPLEIHEEGNDDGMEYLLRYDLINELSGNDGWYGARAATPEDAACKLAIELFKQGVLTREAA